MCPQFPCMCPQGSSLQLYRRRYKVVSADFATNPFPGTMMDAVYRIQLWPVSLDGTTFFEYEAEWMTEPEASTALCSITGNALLM